MKDQANRNTINYALTTMALEHFRNKRPRYLSVLSRLASGCVLSGLLSSIVNPVLGFGVVMGQLGELPSCGSGDGVLRGEG